MIDLHCDTIMQLIDHPHDGDLFSNKWKIDIERLIKGIVDYRILHYL